MTRLRTMASTLVAALAVTALTACGGGQPEAPVKNADGSTTLNMWTFADVHATYYEEMAEKWNEANPDKEIQLEVTVYPYDDMHNKLQLAVNSGEGLPDVVDIEVNKFANFVKK